MIKNIVVIGAGTMGNGIAHTFAQSGFKVNLVDVSQEALDRGLKTITTNLDRIIAKETLLKSKKLKH
jgi:3-hydroxybutyryl-CoA dehydrogenase